MISVKRAAGLIFILFLVLVIVLLFSFYGDNEKSITGNAVFGTMDYRGQQMSYEFNKTEQTLILYNENYIYGKEIAEYYADARGIKRNRICALKMPPGEFIDFKLLREARRIIVEQCICEVLNTDYQGLLKGDCTLDNIDEIAKVSPLNHLVTTKGMPTRIYRTNWSTEAFDPDGEGPPVDYFLSIYIYSEVDIFSVGTGSDRAIFLRSGGKKPYNSYNGYINFYETKDIIHNYKFDSTYEPIGYVKDYTGENQGVIYNAYSNSGVVENAIEFRNFMQYTGSYVDLNNMSLEGNKTTLSVWFKVDAVVADEQKIISKANGTNEQDEYFGLSLLKSGNDFFAKFSLKTDGHTDVLIGNKKLETKKWNHLAATYDGNEMRIYVNGALDSSIPKNEGIDYDDYVETNIGRNPKGYYGFNGLVDQFLIYNVSLDEQKINDLSKLYKFEEYYNQPTSSVSSYIRAINSSLDRRMVYGRIEALTVNGTKELIDRTLSAEREGFHGNVIANINYVGDSTLYSIDDIEYRFLSELVSNNATLCDDYIFNGGNWNYTNCRAGAVKDGNIPGEGSNTGIPIAYNVGLYLGDDYAPNDHRGFDGFWNIRKWRISENCVDLCRDMGAGKEDCYEKTKDALKDFNSDCVGSVNLIGWQYRSFPVINYWYYPRYWTPWGGGTMPVVMNGSAFKNENFIDDKYIRFASENYVDNPKCVNSSYGLEDCNQALKISIQIYNMYYPLKNATGEINHTAKFRYRFPVENLGQEISFRYGMTFTNGSNVVDGPGIYKKIKLDGVPEQWHEISFNLSYSRKDIIVGNYSIGGEYNVTAAYMAIYQQAYTNLTKWIDFDAIEMYDNTNNLNLLYNKPGAESFNATNNEQTIDGDYALNAIDRLGGIGWWGSGAHYLTGGHSYGYDEDFMGAFFSGRTIGESIAYTGYSQAQASGFVYTDPLYSPSGVKIFLSPRIVNNEVPRIGGGFSHDGSYVNPYIFEYERNNTNLSLKINAFHGRGKEDLTRWELEVCYDTKFNCSIGGNWISLFEGFGAAYDEELPINLSYFIRDKGKSEHITLKLRVWVEGEEKNDLSNYASFLFKTNEGHKIVGDLVGWRNGWLNQRRLYLDGNEFFDQNDYINRVANLSFYEGGALLMEISHNFSERELDLSGLYLLNYYDYSGIARSVFYIDGLEGVNFTLYTYKSDEMSDSLCYSNDSSLDTWEKFFNNCNVIMCPGENLNGSCNYSEGKIVIKGFDDEGSYIVEHLSDMIYDENNSAPVVGEIFSYGGNIINISNGTIFEIEAYDDDGDNLTYIWSKSEGPGEVIFGANSSNITNVSFTQPGEYRVGVFVRDSWESFRKYIDIEVHDEICNDLDEDNIYDYERYYCEKGLDRCIQDNISVDEWVGIGPLVGGGYSIFEYKNEYSWMNVSDFIYGRPGFGRIIFKDNVYLLGNDEMGCFRQLNLSSIVFIENNKIEIKNGQNHRLNGRAEIVFEGVYYKEPVVLKDGEICDKCLLLSNDAISGEVRVFVPGFSAYSLKENVENEEDNNSPGGGSGGSGNSIGDIGNESNVTEYNASTEILNYGNNRQGENLINNSETEYPSRGEKMYNIIFWISVFLFSLIILIFLYILLNKKEVGRSIDNEINNMIMARLEIGKRAIIEGERDKAEAIRGEIGEKFKLMENKNDETIKDFIDFQKRLDSLDSGVK
jgi:hypothetical protein